MVVVLEFNALENLSISTIFGFALIIRSFVFKDLHTMHKKFPIILYICKRIKNEIIRVQIKL